MCYVIIVHREKKNKTKTNPRTDDQEIGRFAGIILESVTMRRTSVSAYTFFFSAHKIICNCWRKKYLKTVAFTVNGFARIRSNIFN